MKKSIALAFVAISLMIFTTKAKAQLPFLGQSVPELKSSGVYNNNRPDGTTDYGVYFYHYGSSVNNSTGYYLETDNALYKYYTGAGWVYVSVQDPTSQFFLNGSVDNPNETTGDVNSQSVKLTYGTGRYMFEYNVYAYNPTTNVRIFLWSESVTFTIQ